MLAFEDETWVEHNPVIACTWMPRGAQIEVPSPGRNRRFNVFVTKLYPSRKVVFNVFDRRRSREFKRHLGNVLRHVRRMGCRKAILVMDNAKQHVSKESAEYLTRHGEEFEPFFLPRYSPKLNDVEHVNRALKRHVCSNRFYEDLEDLKRMTRRYLKHYNKCHKKGDLT